MPLQGEVLLDATLRILQTVQKSPIPESVLRYLPQVLTYSKYKELFDKKILNLEYCYSLLV